MDIEGIITREQLFENMKERLSNVDRHLLKKKRFEDLGNMQEITKLIFLIKKESKYVQEVHSILQDWMEVEKVI